MQYSINFLIAIEALLSQFLKLRIGFGQILQFELNAINADLLKVFVGWPKLKHIRKLMEL